MIESFLKLIFDYPLWARVVIVSALMLVVIVLVFGRKEIAPLPPNEMVYLRIMGISVYPDDPGAEVRLVSEVNRAEYPFPNVPGVMWMKVGPAMSRKVVPLPNASTYEVQFRLMFKDGRVATAQDLVKIGTTRKTGSAGNLARTLPYADTFKLYLANDGTASAAVKAEINYELSHDGS